MFPRRFPETLQLWLRRIECSKLCLSGFLPQLEYLLLQGIDLIVLLLLLLLSRTQSPIQVRVDVFKRAGSSLK